MLGGEQQWEAKSTGTSHSLPEREGRSSNASEKEYGKLHVVDSVNCALNKSDLVITFPVKHTYRFCLRKSHVTPIHNDRYDHLFAEQQFHRKFLLAHLLYDQIREIK